MLIAFNKPYRVLCQFSAAGGKPTLADYIDLAGVYPAGRLDFDSEGLVLLTDDGSLQHAIADPAGKLVKRYWAQVEGVPGEAAFEALREGVDLGDFRALPAAARLLEDAPEVGPRDPPIRYRAAVPTRWIEIEIAEGKNRQVRRMAAAVGHPVLRLVRIAIGGVDLTKLRLAPGSWAAVASDQLGLPRMHRAG